ncbi:MAG TPA: selenium-binding protein SBP56-related protein [Candidatus Binatia bacterium]|jgi:selenium-binding protein 1|nr:selenium-binding protein SBP56-related protein [Candidatus Binatia bacterium]
MATLLRPDPTFYPSPRLAAEAPNETLAYTVTFDRQATRPDALLTIDVDPNSPTYGAEVGKLEFPNLGDELHHFGWNACSSALCPYAPHPHIERRYLLVPGIRSSRIYVVDTKPDPRKPQLVKTIEAEEIADRAGYSRPHTFHCGPEGIYVSALGTPGGGGPGGIFIIDHDTFNVKGRFELDRGPQFLSYDFWWHLGQDVLITSEWGTPSMIEDGVNPEILLNSGYGHQLHVWDLPHRKHRQAIDLGKEQQMVLELRPAHDPTKAYGFVGVVVSLENLSSSVWTWYRDGDKWAVRKIIEIPAEPAEKDQLPPALQPFGAVAPLVTDINLSLDDRWLYVSAWGTGEIFRYDVSDPFDPKPSGSVRLGGIVGRAPHPAAPQQRLAGGPQMVEVSRDGRRVYLSNSLYGSWDDQFYPDGVGAWVAKLDAPDDGGLKVDEQFFLQPEQRTHQIHLEGGDASSDSYCYP